MVLPQGSVERGVARAGPGSPEAERGNAARMGAPGWLEVFAEAMVGPCKNQITVNSNYRSVPLCAPPIPYSGIPINDSAPLKAR